MSERTPIKKRGRTRKTTATETVATDEEGASVVIDDGGEVGQVDDEQMYTFVNEEASGDSGNVDTDETIVFVSVADQTIQSSSQEQDAKNIGAGDGVEEVEKHDDETTEEFFQCAVCRQNFLGQVDFFVHLKSHYEPAEQKNTPGTASKVQQKKSLAKKPSAVVETEPKKRGRKRKSELTAETQNLETGSEQIEVEPEIATEPVRDENKVTRSGRISKPRPRDLDMVKLSSKNMIKLEPKIEPYEMDAEYVSVADLEPEKTRIELGDELEDEPFVPVAKVPKKQPSETKVKKPRKNQNSFKRIQLEENGPVKFECSICNKLFANTTSLSVHQRIHKGEKPFKCLECGRDFRQHSDLHYHTVSIHSDKKAYQCEFCGKEFSRKYSLSIHQKIHTGVRDYKCETCQRGFRAAIYLQEHRRIHTGEKPFLCDVCGRGFRIKSDMHRHRINVHYKGHKGAIILKTSPEDEDEDAIGVDDDEAMVGEVNEEEAHFVTITTKNEGDEQEEDGSGVPTQQTMHRLVFISENEAILV